MTGRGRRMAAYGRASGSICLSSRCFRKNKSMEKQQESEDDLLEHHTDSTDAFDTLYIGCEKFPQHDLYPICVGGVR